MSKGKKSRAWKFFIRTVLILNYLLITALLISYTASKVNPQAWWLPSFMGLAYPFLFPANLLFVILWLLLRRWYFMLSLVVILLGWNHIFTNIQFNITNNDITTEQSFKIMSFNARLFRIFNVREDKIITTRKKFIEIVDKTKPDVMCLQEFYSNPYNGDEMLSMLTKKSGYSYYHLDDFLGYRHGIHQGLAIFSKFPIINKERFQFKNSTNNYIIFSDMLVNQDTIRFCNLHFESIRLDKEDYLFIDELTSNRTNEHNWIEGVKMIYWKLKLAFEKRSVQVNQAVEQIKKSPYPIILCGDFNDTPASYTYHQMTSVLNDAFMHGGKGIGRTYAGTMPSYRIDYIMFDDYFKTIDFQTLPVDISDHYPVMASIRVKKE